MRIQLHEHAVFEGARLALIAVDAEVARLGRLGRQEAPLHAGGETSAAASTETGFLDFLQQFIRLELAECSGQRLVAAMLAIDLDLVDAGQKDVLASQSAGADPAATTSLRQSRQVYQPYYRAFFSGDSAPSVPVPAAVSSAVIGFLVSSYRILYLFPPRPS